MRKTSVLISLFLAVCLFACKEKKPDPVVYESSPLETRGESAASPLPESGEKDGYSYTIKEEDSCDSRYRQRGYVLLSKDDGQVQILIFSGEKSTGGYGLEILGLQEEDGVMKVTVRETEPGPDTAVTTALTYPCIALSLSPAPSSLLIENEDGTVYENRNDLLNTGPRAVMVSGDLYLDTGYESGVWGRCGNMDGMIETVIDEDEMPRHDGEANFPGYGWQISSEENTIDVLTDGQFRIFAKEGSPQAEAGFIPENVFRFFAVVEEVREDGTIVVNTDSFDPAYYLFPKNTRYLLPLSAYDPGIYVDSPVPGNPVIIACGLQMEEGDPIVIKEVYQISPIGSRPIQTADVKEEDLKY